MGAEKKIAVFLVVILLYFFAIWKNQKTTDIPKHQQRQKLGKVDKKLSAKGVNRKVRLTGWKPKGEQRLNLAMHIQENTSGVQAKAKNMSNAGATKAVQDIEGKTSTAQVGDMGKNILRYRKYTAQMGDNLWVIARRFYNLQTKSEINEVVKMVELANDWLENPDNLKAGATLQLPILPANHFEKRPLPLQTLNNYKNSTKHKVSAGQTLRKLAKYYYGDETLWYYIFDANQYTLKDPQKLPCDIYIKIPHPICQAGH